jgi:DNA primase
MWNSERKGYVTKGDFLINLAAMLLKKKNGKYYESFRNRIIKIILYYLSKTVLRQFI